MTGMLPLLHLVGCHCAPRSTTSRTCSDVSSRRSESMPWLQDGRADPACRGLTALAARSRPSCWPSRWPRRQRCRTAAILVVCGCSQCAPVCGNKPPQTSNSASWHGSTHNTILQMLQSLHWCISNDDQTINRVVKQHRKILRHSICLCRSHAGRLQSHFYMMKSLY